VGEPREEEANSSLMNGGEFMVGLTHTWTMRPMSTWLVWMGGPRGRLDSTRLSSSSPPSPVGEPREEEANSSLMSTLAPGDGGGGGSGGGEGGGRGGTGGWSGGSGHPARNPKCIL
jgi:hypothetical protein